MKRLAVLWVTVLLIGFLTACGGSSSSNSTTGQVTKLTNRSFISNTFAGTLQVVDTATDVTAFQQSQQTNSAGQQVTVSTPISISLTGALTFEVGSPDMKTTAVYASDVFAIDFVDNSSETMTGSVTLTTPTGMGVFSPDSTTFYAPEPNLPVSGERSGGVQAVDISTLQIAASYAVPSARYLAISTSGQYLLVFASNSDSVFLINLKATPVVAVEIPGFARPVNAFFTSDSTAYVLNCGPECGSTGPASVSQFDIPSQTITATVPVGGASVGLLKSTTLYVAGNPGPAGTVDIVNISNMTRTTPTSIPISDGYHSKMAISTNNKLYVGAQTCSNVTTGCLSVVDLSTNKADPPLGPTGAVTGMQAIPNRNVMYVIQNGYLAIYDTDTNTLQTTQIVFTGALSDIAQVDP